jgi:hypothetical protein
MKINEITDRYVDVQKDAQRSIARRAQSRRLSESIEQDGENFKIIAGSISHYGVSESELIIDQYYFPMNVAADINHKVVMVYMCSHPAKFLGIENGRLVFKYDNCSKTMRFPQDEWLSDYEIGAVAETEEKFKMMFSVIAARYSNTDWEFEAYIYDNKFGNPVKIL